MTLLSFVVKNMQRIPQAILAIAAIALISADPADKSKSLPPDDPADVKTVRAPAPDRVDLDADGNVTMIRADAGYMQVAYSPSVEQAFHRLRHVRSLATVYGVVLEQVKPWTALEQLDVGSANDGHLANLEEMQKLRRLWIHGGFVTDNWVRSIAKLKNLEVLTIEHTEISDACMKQIARLPRLKRLDLKDNAITDRGLSQLKGMKLEFLGLAETKITDRGIDEIKGMTTLKELDVDETEVTNAALVKLKGIPGLKVWGLPREEGPPKKKGPLQPEENRDFENGSDRELAALEGVETIRRLRVCGTAVTDAGVKSIAKLRNLEVLKIELRGHHRRLHEGHCRPEKAQGTRSVEEPNHGPWAGGAEGHRDSNSWACDHQGHRSRHRRDQGHDDPQATGCHGYQGNQRRASEAVLGHPYLDGRGAAQGRGPRAARRSEGTLPPSRPPRFTETCPRTTLPRTSTTSTRGTITRS